MLKIDVFRSNILLFLILFSFAELHAQADSNMMPDIVEPVLVEEDFEILPDLSHPAWEEATPVFIKHQVQPNDDVKAHVETKVKVLYSKDNLYVGFYSKDPAPNKIRANISDRDNIGSDDFVGIFLDPYGNNQQAYEFFVNPLGIQMDAMRTGNSEDMNFDALWYTKGKLIDSGYKAVMKIPFKSLNFPRKDVQNWTIQFLRNYPRSNRYQFSWTNVDLSNSCMLCQNGLLDLNDIESKKTVELIPYGMSYQNSSLGENPDDGLRHEPVKARFGGSLSYSPKSSTSLNAVINPDFSQVETDAAQISANQTFALHYPEKRPFFMKGSELFSTRENLFYSRMINRPLTAGKLTQKTQNYSFAFLTAYDRNAPFVVPGRYASSLINSDLEAYNNALRGKYNFGSESYVGGLLTTRNQHEGYNYVGSFDWKLLLKENYYFNGQIGFSKTREPNELELFDASRIYGRSHYDAAFNGEQFNGTLVNLGFDRQAKYYSFSLGYKSFSPTFQTQNGFINQTDQRQFSAGQNFNYYPSVEWLSSGTFSVNGTWRYDYAGQFHERFIFLRWNNQFAGQTNVSISFLPLNDEQFRGKFFTAMHRTMVGVSTRPTDLISLGVDFNFGKYIRRTEIPSLGEGYDFSVDATLKPNSRLQFDLSYSYSTLSAAEGSEHYYSGDVVRMNARYNFSRKLFARFITQYNSFSEQIQLYPLLYYQANPFTKFYIGMTDDLNRMSQFADLFKETNRQFFVKFQYLIRS